MSLWPKSRTVALCHISNNGLSSWFEMDMLNSHVLRATVAEAAHSLDLGSKRPQEPSAGCCHQGYVTVAAIASPDPAQDRHGDCVRARHLNRQCGLHLVLRLCRLDEGQHR